MTEQEWLESYRYEDMLRFVGDEAPPRKLRLFSCACCYRVHDLLHDPRSRIALETSERYADGKATSEELASALELSREAFTSLQDKDWLHSRVGCATWAVWAALRYEQHPVEQDVWDWVAGAARLAGQARSPAHGMGALWGATLDERKFQCDLLRDIFGNPFRPITIEQAWLAWNDEAVPNLARTIYEDKAFDHLPILGDALKEAGCRDDAILSHCHQDEAHCRGCWLLDHLLGQTFPADSNERKP